MPYSGGKSLGGGEDVHHFTGIRLRVTGNGNLLPTFSGLDDTIPQTLVAIPISSAPGREPMRLANFIGQRAKLELKTSAINEVFRINRIIIFTKPIWTSYPITE